MGSVAVYMHVMFNIIFFRTLPNLLVEGCNKRVVEKMCGEKVSLSYEKKIFLALFLANLPKKYALLAKCSSG